MRQRSLRPDPFVIRPSRATIVAPPLAVAAALFCAAPAAATTCADLLNLALPKTTITLAQSYSANQTVSGSTKAPVDLCRVAGTIKPGPQSNVNFEVWIPMNGGWNGKYQQVGNGGFAGAISLPTIANAVSRGYATAGTDDGTSGSPPDIPRGAPAFINNTDVLLDYGYRAVKATADDSKAIVEALTGQPPQYSYFVGCSDGGREALKEAQNYPDDFDGIIVGSPVNDQVGEFGASYLFDMQATLNGPQTNGVPDAYIPPTKLSLLSNAALAACVGKDGGVASDAFLSDPRQCRFDPGVVQCKRGQDPDTCLTPAQVEAARKIYEGPHEHGILLFPGYEPGGEAAAGDWQSWITGSSPSSPGSQYGLGLGFTCSLVQGVQNCNYLAADVVQQDEWARVHLQPILSSVNPDLSKFRARGGKMIQYAGWADTAIAPQNGLNYYEAVTHKIGDPHDFYRVFMAPGMAHCSGGAGPNAFGNGTSNGPVIDADHDLVKALERWVEQGVAPDRLIATHYVNNDAKQGVQFQRPLCPHPQRAEYVGSGDPTDAASFACVAHHDPFDPRNIGPQRAYKPGK
ncbi:MAG TPA: tannase/feruloyl esterase family alpha/beta hydrolase [Casimicrobiaceae bacterium]|nr:tannase/feruloyl esterase family alpha/beta hydrolase [Casimicrobiaceae bacterium]